MKKLLTRSAIVAASVLPVAAMADTSTALSGAATSFQTEFTASAAIIGTAMVSAAFGAIIWKWIKAAIFS
jgi:hypothetical protein